MRARNNNAGFTLVEMSVVLVIIALLVGGIVSGRSLIHQSQLQTIIDNAKTYAISMQQFKDKYGELPGDFAGATRVWGFSGTTAVPACVSNSGITTVTATGTCDGNGNGTIEYGGSAGATSETFQAWRQLALAGMIQGNYTGQAGPASASDYRFGTNAPNSSFDYTGWMISYVDNSVNMSNHMFRLDYRRWLGMGSNLNEAATFATYADDGFLSNADAYLIDSKMDDGLPAKGNVHGMGLDTGCTNTTDNTVMTATYNLSYAGATADRACALLFSYAMVRTGH